MPRQRCFMAQRAASYGKAVFHKNLTMKHCSAKASQYEAASFHSAMKHFAYAPYDLSSIALCATDDGKIKNESFCLQLIPCFIILTVERKTLMERTSNKLVDLSVAFAVEILNLVKHLKEQRETIICNQIGRAGTSIGAKKK